MSLTENSTLVKNYVSPIIREQLGRTVLALLKYRMHECFTLAIESKETQLTEKSESGAQISFALQGTELRKHIATHNVTFTLQNDEVQDRANFRSHEKIIHSFTNKLIIN